ncbi:MAG: PilN domain-containing protein [Arenimonas sp.]
MNSATGTLRVLPFALTCILFLGGAASVDTAKPVTENVKQSLEAKLASGVRITTLKLDDKRANINGVSPSNALVSQFLRTLTNSPNYTKVELVSIEQKNNAINFYIIADVQCPNAGGEKLCDKSAIKASSVFKCTQDGKTVFQDRPCVKGK